MRRGGEIRNRGVLSLVTALLFAAGIPARAGSPVSRPSDNVRGEEAIRAWGTRLDKVAAAHGMKGDRLRALLRKDRDLCVHPSGRLLYECTLSFPAVPPAAPPAPSAEAPIPIETPPVYHSKRGAPKAIFLDFNGSVLSGGIWGSHQCYPFSTDDNLTTFSDAEQAAIKGIWQRVAEDYAPFNVDVTTEQPTGGVYNVVLVTRSTDMAGQTMPSGGGGGTAMIGGFGGQTPALIYHNNLGNNEAYIAEACSHENGHTLALNHDGSSAGSYYYGHGSGTTSWAPIMGVAYNRNISQFSKGEYYDANQTGEDDFAKILNYLTYRTDDHGNTPAAATLMVVTGGTNITSTTPESDPANANPQNKGIIETAGDVDVWRFTTGAGSIALTVDPWVSPADSAGGNLDVRLELYDAGGGLLAVADPADSLSASVQVTVAAGPFFLHVKPVGAGTPMANPPSGYTVYGSRGQYFLSGAIVSAGTVTNTTHGTPHVWMGRYGITNFEADDARDLDGDGMETWEEYLAGTDPTNRQSAFRILGLSTSGNSASNCITWYGTTNGAGTPFGLMASTNLSAPAGGWQVLTDRVVRAPDGTNRYWHVVPPAGVPWFYRVVATN